MTDRTNATRQALKRRRERDAGLVRVLVVIPQTRREELQEIARRWRDAAAGQADADTPDTQETMP